MRRKLWCSGSILALFVLSLVLFRLRTTQTSASAPPPVSSARLEVRDPEIESLLNEAAAYRRSGRFSDAIKAFEQVLALSRDEAKPAVRAFNELGLLYRNLGDYHQALTLYTRALDRARQVGDDESAAKALHNIGTCYTLLGESRLALDALESAFEMHSSPWGKAYTLTAVATLHDLDGDHDLAISQLRQAFVLRMAAEEKSPVLRLCGRATTLDRLGTALANAGRLEEARRAYESSLELYQRCDDRGAMAVVATNLGYLHLDEQQQEAALLRFGEALPTFTEQGRRHEIVGVLAGTARAHLELGQLDRATEVLEETVAIVDTLRNTSFNPYLRSTFLARHHPIYEALVRTLMKRHEAGSHDEPMRRALQVAERVKARSLLDLLHEERPFLQRTASRQLRQRIQTLEQDLGKLEHQRLARLHQAAPVEEIAAIEKAQRSLILRNQGAWEELRARSAPASRISTPDARQNEDLLDADSRMLFYSLHEDESFLWVIAPERIVAHRLAGRHTIEEAAEAAYRQLTTSDQRGHRQDDPVRDLARLVLPAALEGLTAQRLVIVPDGALHRIPFAVLLHPGGGRPLIRHAAIVTLPSASVLAALRRRAARRRPAARRLVVVADPVYGGNDPRLASPAPVSAQRAPPPPERLRHSQREAAEILKLVDEPERLGLLGFAASRDAVLGRGVLEPFRMVHLSAHVELNARQPELTQLVLSLADQQGKRRDGRIFLHEIDDLSLPCELVVLSACNTALGKAVRGEGLISLTRAFFVAGASRALVSLWYVDDEATAELMVRFYQALFQGQPPDAALRTAQLSLQEARSRWRSPYYWAGFVFQGDWHWQEPVHSKP